MPGRQSTGPPSLGKTRAKQRRKQPKRALDALAIAESENPRKTKIRQSRLGDSEEHPSKRKRIDSQSSEDEDDEATSEKKKRRRVADKDRFGNEIEVGSDSSGNEWVIGEVQQDDDSSLDSDEAFGESDDEKFEGFSFGGNGANISRKKRKNSEGGDDEEKGEEGSGIESDQFEEEAVDLADMLDDEQSEDGSDDDEGSEEEEESALSLSEDEEDAGDSAKLASLKALVSIMDEQSRPAEKYRRPVDAQELTTPFEYGVNSKRKLTVADLVPSVTDPQLRKSLKLLADGDTKSSNKKGIARKLDVPLPKRQQGRLDRVAANEKTNETLDRWKETVKHNRRAEHLSFPLQDPNAVAPPGARRLLSDTQSKPITDLERTIQNIMEESGLAPIGGKSEEDQIRAFEELQANKMPLAEVQARRAELRRARELLFREEIRSKRIKRIKSKSFRKVHRKERERNAQQEHDALVEAGVEESESEKEKNDRRRAEERMGARHRESKWAKGVRYSGRGKWDGDTRDGVTEMARRGEELRKRIEGRVIDDDDDHSNFSESGDEDEDEDLDGAGSKRLERLSGTLQALQEGDELGEKTGGLADMQFMKKAEAARKARNDQDVERMQMELAGEDSVDEGSEEGTGRRFFGPTKKAVVKPPNPFSSGNKSEFEEKPQSEGEDESGFQAFEDDVEIITNPPQGRNNIISRKQPSISNNARLKTQASTGIADDLAANPWLSSSQKGSNKAKQRPEDKQADAIISNSLLPEPPLPAPLITAPKPKPRSALKGSRQESLAQSSTFSSPPQSTLQTETTRNDDTNDNPSSPSSSSEPPTDLLPFTLRNKANIARAFAGDAVTASTTFAREKAITTHTDSPSSTTNPTSLPGWGTWTGSGLSRRDRNHAARAQQAHNPPPSSSTNTTTTTTTKKRQDAHLPRVIISEKTVKKNRKYLASELPHPFETRQQYERALRVPVGPEWTTKETFQAGTRPRVVVRQGEIVRPLGRPLV